MNSVTLVIFSAILAVALSAKLPGHNQRNGNGHGANGNGNGRGRQLGVENGNGSGYTNGNGNGYNGNGNGRGRQLDDGNNQKPMNYDFSWNVDAQDYDNYYGHKESANEGRVDGSYYTWLPDGRLMRVTYYVDGDSGFVPTITYENEYTPQWGTPGFLRR